MRVRRARASGGGGGALRDVPADERFGGTVGESGEEAESARAEGGGVVRVVVVQQRVWARPARLRPALLRVVMVVVV